MLGCFPGCLGGTAPELVILSASLSVYVGTFKHLVTKFVLVFTYNL